MYALLIVSALAITYEDLRHRYVRIYWFVLLLTSIVALQLQRENHVLMMHNFCLNFGFMAVQIGLLHFYYFVKKRSWVWILDRYLGWGDVALWVCLLPVWSLFGFLAFMVCSLVFSLIVYLIFIRNKNISVPLAGLQCLFFLIVYLSETSGLFDFNAWTTSLFLPL